MTLNEAKPLMTHKKLLVVIALLVLLIDCMLVTLKVIQHKPTIVHKPKPNYKYSIYFTSDDGPLVGSKYLNQLVLDYEFPLTLFLVGRPLSQNSHLQAYYDAYKKNPYMLLGNHSFTHANFHYKKFYQESSSVVSDFEKNRDFLELNTTYARLPGRNTWFLNKNHIKGERNNSINAAKELFDKLGYKSYGWDYELRYNSHHKIILSALKHYKRIKKLLKEGKTYQKNKIVILMHDQLFTNDKNSKTVGELILLFQEDDECKLKLLNQ